MDEVSFEMNGKIKSNEENDKSKMSRRRTMKKLMSSIEMALSSSGFRYIVYIKKKK